MPTWRHKEHHAEYTVWANMKVRCTNPKNPRFPHYGGRGIGYDPAWETFAGFFRDMGSRPGPGYSLERRDNDQGYSKANCIWTDTISQANNTSRNHRLTAHGQTLTVAEWSRRCGLPYSTLHNRVQKGWPVERILKEAA